LGRRPRGRGGFWGGGLDSRRLLLGYWKAGGIRKEMGMYNNKLQNIRQTMQSTAFEIEYKPALQQSPPSKQNTTNDAAWPALGLGIPTMSLFLSFIMTLQDYSVSSSCLSRFKYHRILLLSLFPLCHSSSPLSSPPTLPTNPLPALVSRGGDQKIKIGDSHREGRAGDKERKAIHAEIAQIFSEEPF
jgi:hypothetical protein